VRTYQKTLLRYDSDDVRVCVRERETARACVRASERESARETGCEFS